MDVFDRLNELYDDWFGTLRAELNEGGSLPEDERSFAHLAHGLEAISRKVEEIRDEVSKIKAESF